ncbi:polysaccharide biosynthesis/export family protein [Rhodovarius crocodyli]|uniref:polysaccharide biosynthesis/export family protein n=1 Tax=Rhodovarius crocodyli TaxID=1979269 RepID=UPI0013E4043E|nr:polysaccharide biosynthesis/export family protein [Rhodovarius crocodyli]
MRRLASLLLPQLALLPLCGCLAWQEPDNPGDLQRAGYMAERRAVPDEPVETAHDATAWNLARCTEPRTRPSTVMLDAADPLVLSQGDLLRIVVTNDELPTGNYEVGNDGAIALPRMNPLRVVGMTPRQAEVAVEQRLVAAGWYRPGHGRVALSLLERGPVRVIVSGAVFQSGRVVINQRSPQETDTARQGAIGAHALTSTLSSAITFAGGVRPDADIAHVEVRRGGQVSVVDLSGIVSDEPVNDLMLMDGDRVVVPSRRCFQAELARPTPITPPGVRAYISNLSVPANNNAGAAIGRDSSNFPYGIRLLQALASMNCIGGAQMTNADRWAILISVNPLDGQTEVIQRRIEGLVRRRDRDAYNPVIMPNDAIACYDSAVTNGRELLRTLSDAVLSGSLSRAITR